MTAANKKQKQKKNQNKPTMIYNFLICQSILMKFLRKLTSLKDLKFKTLPILGCFPPLNNAYLPFHKK